jgi:dephospho-CoA kinase
MKLIGITGKKRSGKDTIGEYLIKEHGFIRLSFADALKDLSRIVFGFNDEQLYGDKKEIVDEYWKHTPREILQKLGTEIFRIEVPKVLSNIDKNIWVNVVERKMLNILKENKDAKFVITDVRFSNELEFLKKYDGISIRVNRDLENNDFSNHESELSIDKLDVDYDIDNNNTLEDLYKKTDSIL